ncbi:MAG: histidine kinase [Armatimonadota bacterium]|nr:histidine kinase [Armatimonadota bacterium]
MRLQLKILLWIVVITIVVGGISVYTLTLFQRQTAHQQYSSMARTLSATILNSLETTMIRNNPSEIQEIIRRLKAEAIIQKVTIYAADGRVWTSSETQEIGQVVREAALQESIATGSPTATERKDMHQLVIFTPIANAPSCRSCHTKDPAILGAIGVTLGTAPFHGQVTRSAQVLGVLFGFNFLLGIGAFTYLLGRLVLDPLSDLVRAVREIAGGNYATRVPVRSTDELGILASAFNEMAARIQWSTVALSQEVGELTKRLTSLRIFTKTLSEATDIEDAIYEVLGAVKEVFHAEACSLYLKRDGAFDRTYSVGEQQSPFLSQLVDLVARDRVPLMLPGAEVGLYPDRALLLAPLTVKEDLLGTLATSRDLSCPFSEADLSLFTAIATHLAYCMENFRLFKEVKEKEEVRGQLLTKLITAQEDERRRIARELHDEVTQALSGLVMSLNAAMENAPEEMRGRLASMHAVAEATLEEVRRIIHALRPSILDDLGLVHALRWHAKTYLEMAGVAVNFHAIGLSEARLPSALETAIFRVAQEAITNIARHAQAKHVDIRLEFCGDRLSLLVQDDGIGFDEASVLGQKGRPSLGLLGMRERVTLLGGKFHLESKPGRGTKIYLEVPVGKEEYARSDRR